MSLDEGGYPSDLSTHTADKEAAGTTLVKTPVVKSISPTEQKKTAEVVITGTDFGTVENTSVVFSPYSICDPTKKPNPCEIPPVSVTYDSKTKLFTLKVAVPDSAQTGPVKIRVKGKAGTVESVYEKDKDNKDIVVSLTILPAGKITGKVLDVSSAAVQGATVQAIAADGTVKQQAQTSSSGDFTLTLLDPATYTVKAVKNDLVGEVKGIVVENEKTATATIVLIQTGPVTTPPTTPPTAPPTTVTTAAQKKYGWADLAVLEKNWYKNVQAGTNGDFSGDGFVGEADLGIVASNWGGE
jgi:hypothetical protein